jgi:hypothetical protein
MGLDGAANAVADGVSERAKMVAIVEKRGLATITAVPAKRSHATPHGGPIQMSGVVGIQALTNRGKNGFALFA